MILFIADIHIKLGQKNVPKDWQRNRFAQLSDEINKLNPSKVIIGGDLLDVANPSVEEVGLMYDFLNSIRAHKILIPGNHEMVDGKRDCYGDIYNLLASTDTALINEFTTLEGIDYIPYNILKGKWPEQGARIAVTHVRGEIPPHVKAEIGLEKFSRYDKVFTGDLHSYKNSQLNLLYPGSPMVTSFHRNRISGSNGVFLIDPHTFEHEWVELNLPQLIRTTVTDESQVIPTAPDHTIYVLEGNLDELKGVKKSDLVEKSVIKNISAPPTLNMTGSITEELATYLREVEGIEDTETYTTLLEDFL